MKEIYELLTDKFNKEGVETQIDTSDEDIVFRIIPQNIGSDNDGVIITEVCEVPVENSEYAYYQIYTTVAKNVKKEVYPEALLKLNELNLGVLMGYFGILGDYGMVYHKYVAKIEKNSPEKMRDELLGIIFDIIGEIDNDYVEIFGAIK